MTSEEKKQQRKDETDRIPIEGKFGNSKRKGTLDRIMAKLPDTAITVIGVGILVMNLDQLLRQLCALIKWLVGWTAAAPAPGEHLQKNQTHITALTKLPRAEKWAA